jgi:flagellar basal-body rod protein FlgF
MDRLLYVAMTGARETHLAQAVTTNNLANASTTGFRATLAGASHLALGGPGHADARSYAVTEGHGIDTTPGTIVATGRDLDVAVSGRGWIVVQARDGGEAYTRAGDLRIDALGQLTTGAGHAVLGKSGPIALPDFETLEIARDGTISIRPLGQTAASLVEVDRIRTVDPPDSDVALGDDGLVRLRADAPEPAEAAVELRSGALEGSNVSVVGAMVEMIQQARDFELQVKMMSTAEDNDRSASDLLRLT